MYGRLTFLNVTLQLQFHKLLHIYIYIYIYINSLRWLTLERITYTRVGTLIMATIYLQLIQNRYMFRSFTVLHCSHQHCVQPVASDVKVVGYI